MSYAQNLWLFSALLFGIIILPGMDMVFVITNALTGGRKAGLAATAGIMCGGLLHTLFGALLVGSVLRVVPQLFTVILVLGAGYMVWIGVSLLRSSPFSTAISAGPMRRPATAFRQGAMTCLLNPKAYMFVAAVYPQFLRPEFGSLAAQAVVMAALTVSTQFAIYGGLAEAATWGQRRLTPSPAASQWIARGAGVLFIAVAVVTLYHLAGQTLAAPEAALQP
jgi:threonine/homoserine/homoserine lactone efflux protein